ncbi:MAG: hypothetical protein GWN01_02590 [Nitrosopumilaceae archaeon]|nr:hypothetical protein [Nitrosopumilaceae archaeon]NIT99855.1 hypothetical protein [Nitrosopumilaceae archaeon]NIU86218.1 hypothetical protein [Nitrosopumilaceae archaeon]NIV64979.1 hypothetical protein [Nitrosopumilaceae archaeon]NIX60458.1 hypothetical protein [Nitrosopumilaceae archaeon]
MNLLIFYLNFLFGLFIGLVIGLLVGKKRGWITGAGYMTKYILNKHPIIQVASEIVSRKKASDNLILKQKSSDYIDVTFKEYNNINTN